MGSKGAAYILPLAGAVSHAMDGSYRTISINFDEN